MLGAKEASKEGVVPTDFIFTALAVKAPTTKTFPAVSTSMSATWPLKVVGRILVLLPPAKVIRPSR